MKLEINDYVAYSAQFCRSIGAQTGDIPAARGRITDLKTVGSMVIASVRWNCGSMPEKVNTANLAKVGPNLRFCNC